MTKKWPRLCKESVRNTLRSGTNNTFNECPAWKWNTEQEIISDIDTKQSSWSIIPGHLPIR